MGSAFTLSTPIEAEVVKGIDPELPRNQKVELVKATADGKMAQPQGFQEKRRYFPIEVFRLSAEAKRRLKEELDKHNEVMITFRKSHPGLRI